jgi:hypothetical protein
LNFELKLLIMIVCELLIVSVSFPFNWIISDTKGSPICNEFVEIKSLRKSVFGKESILEFRCEIVLKVCWILSLRRW